MLKCTWSGLCVSVCKCVCVWKNLLLVSKKVCMLKLYTCITVCVCVGDKRCVSAVCVQPRPSITLTIWAFTCQGPLFSQQHSLTHTRTHSSGDVVPAPIYSLDACTNASIFNLILVFLLFINGFRDCCHCFYFVFSRGATLSQQSAGFGKVRLICASLRNKAWLQKGW